MGQPCAVRRPVVLLVLVVSLGLLAACNPDPTTGRPPDGPPARAFTALVKEVGPGTPWPLGSSWRPGCPVGPEDLRLVEVTRWGFDGNPYNGRIVVATHLTDEVIEVFRQLYEMGFQISHMEPVDDFGGSDAASMAADNTSGFNCRTVAGTSTWSEHSYGTAIDLNPVQNPYVRDGVADPPGGGSYLDRVWPTPGLVRDGDAVVTAVADNGFRWGGHWTSAKDYQHFSLSGR
jgi:hypothetical protein